MAESIEKVQIEVEASVKSAGSALSQLESDLTRVNSVLKNIDTSKISSVTKSTKSMSIDTSGMTKAEQAVSSDVNKIKQSLAGLESIKNAALSGDSSSLTSFNRRVTSIQGSIDVLREKMSQLGVTSVESSQFTQLKSQSETLDNQLTTLKAKMDDVLSGKTTVSDSEFQQLTDDIVNTRTELESVNSEMQNMASNGTAYINADTLTADLQSAKTEVDDFVSSVNGANPQFNTDGISSSLSAITEKASEAASSLWSMVKSGISSGFSSLKSKLSGIKDTLTSIGSKASSTVSTGFSKILKYGFGIRSLYVLFRRLRTAVKDSFTELQNSGAYYQTTKANIDALKSSLSTLKYQFGAAFEPIFNTVAPALQTLINYLVTVMNTISAFIAKLTGKSTYSKAVASTAAIADNTGSAAGSAAELNKQLQGFDELNNISPDSGSSGGSGGGSSSDSSSVTYEEASVDSALTSFWDSLSDAITNGEWFEAGTIISDALTEALASIDWDSIFEGAADFGTNLADFLNGLITDDLFYQLGRTIANAIKTALIAAFTFGSEFDWEGLGTAIASGINGFVDQNPLKLLVAAFNVWAEGILDTLIAAIDNIHWDDIADHIADAISSLEVSEIMGKLGTLASKIANALYTLVSNKETWSELGTKIGEGISSFFSSMNKVDSKTGLTGWQALGNSITSTISGLLTTLKTAIGTIEWDEVGQSIADFIAGIDLSKITWDLLDLAWEIIKALVSAIKSLWEDGDAKTKIGLAIVGLIAVAKLTGLSSTLSSIIGAAIPSSIPITNPINLSFLGKVALVAGAAFLGWEAGKSISQWIAEKLSGTDGISAEAVEDYVKVSQNMKLEMVWDEITSAATEETSTGENRLWKAYNDMMNDWYEPIYNEIDKEQEKNSNKTKKKDSNGNTIEEGPNWNSYQPSQEKSGFKSKVTLTTEFRTKLTGAATTRQNLNDLSDSFNELRKSASESTEATYSAKTGGQLTDINTLDTWRQKVRNLISNWFGASATYRASVGGQMTSINDMDSWTERIQKFDQDWQEASSDASFNVNSNVNDADGQGGYLERLNKVKEEWKKGNPHNAEFKTSLTGSVTTKDGLDNVASSFKTLGEKFPSGEHSSSWSTTLSGASASDIGTYAKAAKSLYDSFYTGSHTGTWTITLNTTQNNVNDFINSIISKLNSKLNSTSVKGRALGGAFYGGSWHSIPQYASGTLNAGSVFVAGEAGPEIVGQINGRTEVLNKSQIASIMSNSFVQAMGQFGNRLLSTTGLQYNMSSYNGYNSSSGNENSYMMAQQNELLREQNDLLRTIASKDVSISSRDVFKATQSEANNYYNRTGNSPFLY